MAQMASCKSSEGLCAIELRLSQRMILVTQRIGNQIQVSQFLFDELVWYKTYWDENKNKNSTHFCYTGKYVVKM